MKGTLFIIRGLPGSGKSTLGGILAPGHSFAADDYFMENGVYNFNPRALGEAHGQCLQNVIASMKKGASRICVCNTFTTYKEMAPYRKNAETYGYSVFVIHCQNDFGNVHNVPVEAIQRMDARWED